MRIGAVDEQVLHRPDVAGGGGQPQRRGLVRLRQRQPIDGEAPLPQLDERGHGVGLFEGRVDQRQLLLHRRDAHSAVHNGRGGGGVACTNGNAQP